MQLKAVGKKYMGWCRGGPVEQDDLLGGRRALLRRDAIRF